MMARIQRFHLSRSEQSPSAIRYDADEDIAGHELKTLKGDPVTVHGFRSAFLDWTSNETDFPRELIEESFAHSLGSVEAAYRRGAAIERRRKLMEVWSSILRNGAVETSKKNDSLWRRIIAANDPKANV